MSGNNKKESSKYAKLDHIIQRPFGKFSYLAFFCKTHITACQQVHFEPSHSEKVSLSHSPQVGNEWEAFLALVLSHKRQKATKYIQVRTGEKSRGFNSSADSMSNDFILPSTSECSLGLWVTVQKHSLQSIPVHVCLDFSSTEVRETYSKYVCI